jgi:hypothetical protein
MLSIQEAVDFIQANYGGGNYNARYDNTDANGNYSIQVSEYVVDHTVTYDWFTVNPTTHAYTSMFNGFSGQVPFQTKQQEYLASFGTGFNHYGGGFGKVSAARTVDNMVTLQGLAAKDAGGGAIKSGEIVLTLPEIYRPKQTLIFWQQSYPQAIRVDISPNGQVKAGSDGSYWVSLSGITYNLDLGL